EDIGVFQRIGESTDVVRKEMYDFHDKGGRHIALRPEGTASVARAFVEHRPTVPFKAWYATPSFRYEAPQAGRFRQHHQLGVEAIGSSDPDLDVEVIALLVEFHRAAGVAQFTLRLTSLGDDVCRPAYRALLEAHLATTELCGEHTTRYKDNPLRVFDCKRPECVAATKDAPVQVEHLCEPCTAHYQRVKAGLDALGIAYEEDRRLVRGLDYYTRTTFEFSPVGVDAAQNAIGGGGRYDKLIEELGGPSTPGIGFGVGIERELLAIGDAATPSAIRVFVVDTTGGEHARDLTALLRTHGIAADRAFDQRSLKAQLKAADRAGAAVALIIGPDEATNQTVTVRDLTNGEQRQVPRADVLAELTNQ
ncbi:MAG TPA: histidine--tRNA ligase, partial [Acidimicrobiales bacterium]|nr:histidine--tRNA ligase [Acidimicrobiales bacterium]